MCAASRAALHSVQGRVGVASIQPGRFSLCIVLAYLPPRPALAEAMPQGEDCERGEEGESEEVGTQD